MLTAQPFPSLIKYMGSKTKIIDFIVEGINFVHREDRTILDLFAGSASLAGAIGNQVNFVSNDIQQYSKILSKTYLVNLSESIIPQIDEIYKRASSIVGDNLDKEYIVDYSSLELKKFNDLESKQKELINKDFLYDYHLFTKNYSGTWWSYEQCVWIDALREIADSYKDSPIYSIFLSSLMFAMAYTSQGTGHYAQYRDAKTNSSFNDICIYRKKEVFKFFQKKFKELCSYNLNNITTFTSDFFSLDFKEALATFQGGTVYADPPYCFVHYSRFYHILETLVLYDYPQIQKKNEIIVKGRYREDRHQSPFCIKTKVEKAFLDMFEGVRNTDSQLVLSYSNTGMISLETMMEIASSIWDNSKIEILTTDHQHMTLGRQGTRYRDVKECLLLVK
ncbi:DNA adenine methylase [Acinetobacter baumannii]|uniref:DNA adenine methylase n=1 Tax=Acinetobacter baumannii TaxID=470 RepID=UPI00144A687A|nr:DNA adenine methylase [Acinetobacter baumannii]EIM5574935.1 DNA adenine methylase [Acinetobacter baumannii]EIO1626567.1 DNA adenine methylase [Acinetobacter baumannii]EKX8585412.1 DNA adenine methylase [Acinetobacter baumannii]NLP53663.1 restriction endonuclease [Acinetobacter baumannii]NQE73361.1 Site-specific DNA-methyltransferase [Acinetobacter baumannii]